MKKLTLIASMLLLATPAIASALPNETTKPLERGVVILPRPKLTIDTTTSIKRGGGGFPVIRPR